MATKLYALTGRYGHDDGGRYLSTQWKQMRVAAWRMHCAGSNVQVWTVAPNGDLMRYDGVATRRVSDAIFAARAALAKGAVAA